MAKTVELTAVQDDDFADDAVTLVLTASGGGYDGVSNAVAVTVTDNDVAGLTVSLFSVAIPEGGTGEFTVALSAQPSADVTVALSGDAGTDVNPSVRSLTFTTTSWRETQTVALTAAQDEDYIDDEVTLVLTASGGGYDGVSQEVAATIIDDEEAPLALCISNVLISEDAGMAQFTVMLNRPADHVVSVHFATSDGTAERNVDYTSNRGIMIFEAGSMRGAVSVTIMDDALVETEETFEVTLTNVSNAIIDCSVGVGTIMDNDGVPSLRIDDITVFEDQGTALFTVRMSRPSMRMVTARYRTVDGTAQAGIDYEASEGTMSFAPGEVEAGIEVKLLRDGRDWREEEFSVQLESAEHAHLEDAVGVATVVERETVPVGVLAEYVARFVRTSADHVVEALGERVRWESVEGSAELVASGCTADRRAERMRLWRTDPSLGELLSGCGVLINSTSSGSALNLWSRGAFTRFSGRDEGALALRGEVSTGLIGVDSRWGRGWLAGLMLAHSQSDGTFEVYEDAGDVRAGLTGIYPYVAHQRPAHVFWATAGYGRGRAEAAALDGGLGSGFAGVGARGELTSGSLLRLMYRGDALIAHAEVARHKVTAQIHRIRVGVDGSLLASRIVRPYVEVGVRQDGGSAETGVGIEIGGGFRMAYPAYRLRADMRSRGLVTHTAEGFTEWGLSGALQYGGGDEGLTVALRPSWGHAQGVKLWRQQTVLEALSGAAGAAADGDGVRVCSTS